MITGTKITRPNKQQLVDDIADALKIPHAQMSTGSTVVSTILDEINAALVGVPTGGADTYRMTETVLESLGLAYDPYWDTSESTPTGGGTVTARAYSRIRSAVTKTPRCFILNTTDAPVGARWETDHQTVYRYDDTVTGRMPLNDAGPGSRVIHYSTSNSSDNKMKFVSHAEVKYIGPGWTGPWEAQLTGYAAFASPVPVADVEILGWNRQHAITEISWETYREIVEAGGAPPPEPVTEAGEDPGGDVVAERVIKDFPAAATHPTIDVPDSLPAGVLTAAAPKTPTYTESSDGDKVTGGASLPPRSATDRKKDRLAEKRAVELTIQALEVAGWTYTRDRQKDGVGYDLEFEKAAERLNVEVKGIQGKRLAFNITPKELWRAETDKAWVLVAVTSVLSPTSPKLHLITRDKVAGAAMTITGYRATLAAGVFK